MRKNHMRILAEYICLIYRARMSIKRLNRSLTMLVRKLPKDLPTYDLRSSVAREDLLLHKLKRMRKLRHRDLQVKMGGSRLQRISQQMKN